MLPENAQLLMRSRYSAYSLLDSDYLMETWHSDYGPQNLILEDDIRWIGLQVMDFQDNNDHATVEFEARFLIKGQVDAVHEDSCFVNQQGRWLYTRGDQLSPSFQPWKPGRNEDCPCGSGKKFKCCCMSSGAAVSY